MTTLCPASHVVASADQASNLQRSRDVNSDILAVSAAGGIPSWQQSKQSWALPAMLAIGVIPVVAVTPSSIVIPVIAVLSVIALSRGICY